MKFRAKSEIEESVIPEVEDTKSETKVYMI